MNNLALTAQYKVSEILQNWNNDRLKYAWIMIETRNSKSDTFSSNFFGISIWFIIILLFLSFLLKIHLFSMHKQCVCVCKRYANCVCNTSYLYIMSEVHCWDFIHRFCTDKYISCFFLNHPFYNSTFDRQHLSCGLMFKVFFFTKA